MSNIFEANGFTIEKLRNLSDSDLLQLEMLLNEKERDLNFAKAKSDFLHYAKYVRPEMNYDTFHGVYYRVLSMFAMGEIKKLLVTIPPQHGKSTGSTELLPSYMLGLNPDLHIAIASYSATFAKKFNRKIQRIIDDKVYHNVFPQTTLANNEFSDFNSKGYLRTAEEFEVVNASGSLKAVGRGGALTGSPVDIMILDDLYKDYEEANSPIIRQAVIDWYTTVIRTRLHNDSQELIVFTRWHEEDLIGWLEEKEDVVTVESFEDLDNIPKDAWVKINFEALKESAPTEIDRRNIGESLWPQKHGVDKLMKTRSLDVENFNCLYQGNPISKEGLMYSDFKTYSMLPEIREIKNYTDTADTGKDFLCSINYAMPLDWGDNNIYILDVIYTQEPMEKTEPMVINMLNRWRVSEADIESNNGGRGFARTVEKSVNTVINSFPQRSNKESRIYTRRAQVNRDIVFPQDWATRWPEFYSAVTRFKKKFKANKHDDCADTLTGIVEKASEGFSVEDIMVYDD